MTAHKDVFTNAIMVDYYSNGRVQEVTDTWNRPVTFTYSACGPRQCLRSITAGPGGIRRVDYSYTTHAANPASGSRDFLTGVTPAAGRGYSYTYAATATVPQNKYALSSITYPFGGSTEYTYGERRFFTGREITPMAVVLRRTTSGRELPRADWDYEYDGAQGSDFQFTTVTRPDAEARRLQIHGLRAGGAHERDGPRLEGGAADEGEPGRRGRGRGSHLGQGHGHRHRELRGTVLRQRMPGVALGHGGPGARAHEARHHPGQLALRDGGERP